jgi:hypothetical protein
MRLYQLIAISLSTLTLYSCSGTPLKSSVLPKLPQKSAWQKDEGFRGSDVLFPKQTITSKYDVRKPDKVTAAQLDAVLKGVLAGKGKVILAAANRHGICPRFYTALICWESGYGLSSNAKRNFNVAGRMKMVGKRSVPMKFNSVDECIYSSAEHLAKNYVGKNLVTVSQVKSKFCPNGAKNDPRGLNSGWTKGVLGLMSKI